MRSTQVDERVKQVKVVQDADKVIEVEILAKSIEKLGKASDEMSRSGLSERAIVTLISEASGETKTTVRNVLAGMKDLRRLYLR